MNIVKIQKARVCFCCREKLPKRSWVNEMNGKYFKLYHGKIYRLHTESIRWIKANFLNKG